MKNLRGTAGPHAELGLPEHKPPPQKPSLNGEGTGLRSPCTTQSVLTTLPRPWSVWVGVADRRPPSGWTWDPPFPEPSPRGDPLSSPPLVALARVGLSPHLLPESLHPRMAARPGLGVVLWVHRAWAEDPFLSKPQGPETFLLERPQDHTSSGLGRTSRGSQRSCRARWAQGLTL